MLKPRAAYALMKGEASYLIFNSFFLYFSFSHVAYGRVNVEAGHDAVLNCPSISKLSLLMVTWKMKSSNSCFLAYRRDLNETRMLNCSERMMWKYSPDRDPALRIYFVNLNDEGNDTCEITSSEGNFLFFFSLTVIGKTHLVLFHCCVDIKQI